MKDFCSEKTFLLIFIRAWIMIRQHRESLVIKHWRSTGSSALIDKRTITDPCSTHAPGALPLLSGYETITCPTPHNVGNSKMLHVPPPLMNSQSPALSQRHWSHQDSHGFSRPVKDKAFCSKGDAFRFDSFPINLDRGLVSLDIRGVAKISAERPDSSHQIF